MKNKVFLIVTLSITLLILLNTYVLADTCRVQMPASGYDPLGGENITLPGVNPWTRLGQRLMILNRTVLSIGYHVRRVGSPTGNVTLSIRDAATDEILFSKVWGNASLLPESGSSGYCEVMLDPPLRINREVRLCVEYDGGNSTDYCQGAYYTGDKITGESYTNYRGQWHDIGEAEEGSYCYAYVCQAEPPDGDGDNADNPNMIMLAAIIGNAAVAVLGIGYLVRNKRRA